MDENTDIVEIMRSTTAEDFFNAIAGESACCEEEIMRLMIEEYRSILGAKRTPLEKKVDKLGMKKVFAKLAAMTNNNEIVLKYTGYKDSASARAKVGSIDIKLQLAVALLKSNDKANNKKGDEDVSFNETLALVSINAGFKIEQDVDLLTFLYYMKALQESNKTKE